MEINEYPRSPLQSNKAKQNTLRRTAVSEYEASQIKAGHIKPSGQEARTAQINKNEHRIIKGEVIDLRYQEVKIRLEPSGQVLNARLSGEVSLSIGQTAEFAVSDETDGQITLRYISTNDTSVNDIVRKALSASGLSESDRNLAIVQELLNFNMPVDKNTILQLIKLTASYPNTSLTTLVLMHKNQLPINVSNIAQFEAYHNNMHQILSQLKSLIGNISDILASDKSDNIMITKDDITSDILYRPDYVDSEDMVIAQNDSKPNGMIHAESNIKPEDITNAKSNVDPDNNTNTIIDIRSENGIYNPDYTLSIYRELLPMITENEVVPAQVELAHIELDKAMRSLFSDDEITQLQNRRNDLYGNEHSQTHIENTTLPGTMFKTFVSMSDHLPDTTKDKLMHFLKSETCFDLITDILHHRWTLSTKDLTRENKVREFFKRLDEDMDYLKKLTETTKQFDTKEVKTSINKLQDNLQFMRDLNELFLYLQLPMRLTGQDVHGDLYVFTRKKGKHHDTEKLNILLHLDMENLGSMDIHMTMKNHHVSAVFYMEEASEQIIAGHLHELVDTLQDKGYQFQAKTKISDTKPDFITDVLQQNTPNPSTHRYSFDIRA